MLSGDIASNLPGLCHAQRLWSERVVWMVNLLQGVLWSQWVQGAAHSHQKSEPVPSRWRGKMSRTWGERTLHAWWWQSTTMYCVSTCRDRKSYPLCQKAKKVNVLWCWNANRKWITLQLNLVHIFMLNEDNHHSVIKSKFKFLQ